MIKEIFTRRELKYLIPFDHYRQIIPFMTPYVEEDPFAGESGSYQIVSLYFDSPEHKIYFDTRNRAPFRQKLRLRMYNHYSETDDAFFEIKQKYKNIVSKRRTVLKLSDAYRFIQQDTDAEIPDDAFGASNRQVLKEISSFRQMFSLSPNVIVSYERHAFQGKADTDLRITFDHHLTCRSDNLRLEPGMSGAYFVDPNFVIMEIKISDSVPLWLARLLSDFRCPGGNVSKYCTSVDLVCPVISVSDANTAVS